MYLMIQTIFLVGNVAHKPLVYFQSIWSQEEVAVWSQELPSFPDTVGACLKAFCVIQVDLNIHFLNVLLDLNFSKLL